MSDLTDLPATIDTALLDRVLAGQGTPDDVAIVTAWAARDPGNEAVRHALARLRRGLHPTTVTPNVDAAWEHLRANRLHRVASTGDTIPAPRAVPTRQPRPSLVQRWALPMAAMLAIVAGAVLVATHDRTTSGTARTWTTYATTTGQVAHVTLRDGSRVTLAPATQLLVPSDFGRSQRDVRVSGEVYFDVARVSGAPFRVHAGSVRTNVLGTAFDVTHYPGDADVRVAVTSGKVSVGTVVSRRPSITLTAGAVGHVTDSTATVTLMENPTDVNGWTNGHIVFHRATIAEVLATVERWYGYQFRLADTALARQHITTTLDYDARADVLTSLKALLDVSMTFDGNVITLHPHHAGEATKATERAKSRTPGESLSPVKELGR